MHQTTIDTDFDSVTSIPELTVNNIGDIPFEKMLAILAPFVLVQVPESYDSVDDKRRLDYLLARTANLHAYLMVLWSQCTFLRAKLKAVGSAKAEDIQKKKETLYELASATKLKYEAVSRKVTVLYEGEGNERMSDRVNHESRQDTADARSDRREQKTADAARRPNAGGWGAVG